MEEILFDINAIKEFGFHYESIGRATAIPVNNQYINNGMNKKRVLITGAAGFLGSIYVIGLSKKDFM